MSTITGQVLPDHTQLPESDGKPVENFFEFPQCILLTDCLLPILRSLHPDGRFAIGQNSGIYWEYTDPPLDGCKAPDWFYVPGVPPSIVEGHYRRSYVLWQEKTSPSLIIEIASGDGSEENDTTPRKGKFWVYEQMVRAPYYAIFVPDTQELSVHHLVDGHYQRQEPNEQGRYPMPPLGVALGLWTGQFQNNTGTWLRWFDAQGRPLPTGDERAELERERAELERKRAERLAERLRALGDNVNGA